MLRVHLHTGDLGGRNNANQLAVIDIAYPALILPPTLQLDGVDRFHVEALAEPAKTGFERYRGTNFPSAQAPEPLAKAQDYVAFLMRG